MAASAWTRVPAARRRIVAGAVAAACALGATACVLVPAATRVAVPAAQEFTISGAPDQLRPGRPAPLDLTVTNPNGFAVRLTELRVAVARRTSLAGCLGDRDFRTSALQVAVNLPPRSSTTLSALGVPVHRMPTVTAPVAGVGCSHARVTLRYSGRAVLAR
jgi:hypothetical protein